MSSLSEEDGQPKLTQLCIGVNDLPLKAYQNGEVTSLYIKLEIKRDGEVSETEPVKLSHDEITSIPDTPPPFSAKIELIMGGYALKGVFTDFLPNVAQVRPMYSLDGELYEPVGVDEMSRDEPMNSYVKHGLERFYIKLQITTETGETYDTEAATTEDVYALLPTTLPIEVRIANPDTVAPITTGIVECEVNWKELPQLSLTAGETFTIRDAANELVVPAGKKVSTPLGIYVLSKEVALNSSETSDEVRIVMNAIGAEEKPDISLNGDTNDGSGQDKSPLSLAFHLKPSGATSVKAYSFVEGDEDWTELCELLSFRDVNANQSAEMYDYVDALQPDDSPYAEYLRDEITGFLIGIIIEGGNEGNAGSGDGSGDSAEGGQRPDLPDDGAPPVTEPPPGTSNPPDGSGTPPSTPDIPESAVPSLPDGNTTTSRPTDTAGNGECTVSLGPPADSGTMLPTKPDNKETATSTPTETGSDKAAKLPVWNEVKPQEQT